LGEAVAQVLQHETHASVIRVRIDGTESASSLAAWAKAPVSERGGVAMVDYQAAVSREELMQIAHMLTHLSSRFQYVLVEASPHASIDVVSECAAAAGSTYVLLRQNAENLFAFSLFSREIRTRLDSIEFLRPLVWLAAEENAHGLSQYIRETVGLPVHMYLRESDGNGLVGGCAPGWRRLAREICGRRVGLALASGAARGLSHIGVIQVLEENGIEVDAVAGSSMGAYVAAVWGKGYSGREMEKFARTLEGYKGMWRLMDTVFPPVRGFLHTDRVRKRLQRTIGSAHFSDMVRPIRVVATRIDTLERVVFHGGNVVDAVLASIAIPGVCVPVELDGVPYVDGGIVDPLPVSALEEMGIDKIIAVNTIATPASMRAYREIAEADRQGFLGAQLARWNALWNPFAYGNAFDTLLRSIHASQTRMAEASCSRANVVLRPYSCDGRWHDFGRPAHYIELGRKAAEEQLGEIKALFSLPPQ
jgi:NTE family protein